MRLVFALFGVVATVLLTVAMLFTAGWSHPPIVGTRPAFAAPAWSRSRRPRPSSSFEAANALPDPIPKASPDGPTAQRMFTRTSRC